MTFDSVIKTFGRVRRKGLLTVAALATVAGLSGGCSSVPDAANPVEWYKGTRDWMLGDDEQKTAKVDEAKPVPGSDKPFPKLDTVPDRPVQTTEADRKQMANSLTADRDAARYSDEKIRRQTSAVAAGTRSSTTAQIARQAAPVSSVPATAPPMARRGPAVTNQTASAAPTAQGAAQLPPVSPFPDAPSAPPPPPAISPVVTAGQPIPLASASSGLPVSLPGAEMQGLAAAGPPGTVRVARTAPRTAAVSAGRFSPRFPSGATAVQRPAYVSPPTFGYSPPPSPFDVAPSAGFAPGSVIPRSAGLTPASQVAPGTEPVVTIRFGVGSARINARARRQIRQAFQAYQSYRGRIIVVGHASSRTRNLDRPSHELANFRVSDDRARAVARELIRMGVDPSLIVIRAVSDQQPAFIEVMPAGEAGNRRTEIFFTN